MAFDSYAAKLDSCDSIIHIVPKRMFSCFVKLLVKVKPACPHMVIAFVISCHQSKLSFLPCPFKFIESCDYG